MINECSNSNMKYKDKFYESYVSSHVSPSKGEITPGRVKGMATVWRKIFGRFLPEDKNARIIDLGCGYGSIVWWLKGEGFTNACGIDISSEQIETGKKCGVTGIEIADIKEFLRDKKCRYDVIFARDLIEHFNKADIFEVLTHCYQSLSDAGLIIVQVPNAESPFGGRIRYGDFTHEIAFTTSSLSQVLRMAGFNSMKFYPSGPTLIGPELLIRFLLWKVVEACYKFLLFVETGNGKRVVTENIIAVAIKEA